MGLRSSSGVVFRGYKGEIAFGGVVMSLGKETPSYLTQGLTTTAATVLPRVSDYGLAPSHMRGEGRIKRAIILSRTGVVSPITLISGRRIKRRVAVSKQTHLKGADRKGEEGATTAILLRVLPSHIESLRGGQGRIAD